MKNDNWLPILNYALQKDKPCLDHVKRFGEKLGYLQQTFVYTITVGSDAWLPLIIIPSTHHISIHQERWEVDQNPGRHHEDNSIEAQDVEQPQMVYLCVSQNLLKEKQIAMLHHVPLKG